MTEGSWGDRKTTRRDFTKGMAIAGGAAVGGAVLSGCAPGPIAEKAFQEVAKIAAAETKRKKEAEDYQAAERATKEAPKREWEQKIEAVKAQREALKKAVEEDFLKRNSPWRVAGIEFVDGEVNPLATEERQVFTQPPNAGNGLGLRVRTSPAIDGEKVASLEDLTRLGKFRFKLEIRKTDGSEKSFWAAVEAKELSKHVSLPSQPEPLVVSDKQGGEKKYYFYCLEEMGQSYTREIKTQP